MNWSEHPADQPEGGRKVSQLALLAAARARTFRYMGSRRPPFRAAGSACNPARVKQKSCRYISFPPCRTPYFLTP